MEPNETQAPAPKKRGRKPGQKATKHTLRVSAEKAPSMTKMAMDDGVFKALKAPSTLDANQDYILELSVSVADFLGNHITMPTV